MSDAAQAPGRKPESHRKPPRKLPEMRYHSGVCSQSQYFNAQD